MQLIHRCMVGIAGDPCLFYQAGITVDLPVDRHMFVRCGEDKREIMPSEMAADGCLTRTGVL